MKFGSILFTPVVQKLQERYGSRRQYERIASSEATRTQLTPFEIEFLSERDSFYWATVSSSGWPYVQHRGGPPGFLKVIDNRTLAFADFAGNRQYITTGNLLTDDRVAMILVDYPNQARLKILGRAKVVEGEEAAPWIKRTQVKEYKAIVERAFIIDIEAFDWNCQQHIVPRYTSAEIHAAVREIEDRLHDLESENQRLRQELANTLATTTDARG
ncbi:pyridoxamine 5'-phosphate oxidase [Granulicella sp. WH15]|uniref:pyridoxamine 5'-phosphate oxidase family protein n=1 Tax=Granulicella sp. WH15 TaxID=2602070 RepID=UPI0013673FA8|nr:pyridoxamine 5'-phosphate oxidase family protein [Granulicella sp. WH15]QHN04711.1 pyridoxamine 5'-phosphate oxidase [Granulicella sp. WH15]